MNTRFLQRLYVNFFIELGSRRLHIAGGTAAPDAAWVTQQACQLAWQIQERAQPLRVLLPDRDAKFPPSIYTVFAAVSVAVIRTPYRAPHANAHAEHWIRSRRAECLDHVLIATEAHLRRVLAKYVALYNHARPHQCLVRRCPVALLVPAREGPVRRRDRLGELLHDYYREAA